MKPYIFKTFIALCFLIISAPQTTHAKQAQAQQKKILDIKQVTSTKGITAWLVEDHTVPVIALKFSFRGAGAKNEPPEKQGLARLVSNTMDEGAGELTSEAFQKTLKNESITLYFNSGRDNFGGELKTLTQNKDTAFGLLKLALSKPRFDQEPVDRMRKSNQSRIKSSMANPKWIAARLQNDKIFENHPYAQNSGGTLSSLDNITIEDLKNSHKTLGKNQLVIGASGDITASQLKTAIDEIFGDMPDKPIQKPETATLQNQGKTYLFEKDIPQTIIEISQTGIKRASPDYHSAQVMNFILGASGFGSRLMEEIREKRGLTYGIYSYIQNYDAVDLLRVSTSTTNEKVSEMLSLINQEWQKIKETPVTEKELQDAKSYLIGSLPLSLTSTDSIAGLLLSLQLDELPIDYLDKRQTAIQRLTIEDIQKSADHLLNSNNFTTILVGHPKDQNGISETIETITTLPNVK